MVSRIWRRSSSCVTPHTDGTSPSERHFCVGMLALGPLQQLVEVGRRDGAVMRSYRRHRVWVVRCRIRRTSSEVRLRWIMCKTCESDSMKNENDAKGGRIEY